jgi:DNA modification methylase
LDPILGSGTTLLVADQLGRVGIGIELSPDYAQMAERRIRGSAPMFTTVEVS